MIIPSHNKIPIFSSNSNIYQRIFLFFQIILILFFTISECTKNGNEIMRQMRKRQVESTLFNGNKIKWSWSNRRWDSQKPIPFIYDYNYKEGIFKLFSYIFLATFSDVIFPILENFDIIFGESSFVFKNIFMKISKTFDFII